MDPIFEDFKARMDREFLKSAVCREIFCGCGSILDVRDAVLVEASKMYLMCGKCFHEDKVDGKTLENILQAKLAEHPEIKDKVRILDGKVLSRKTRMPKCKYPRELRPDPLKEGFPLPTEPEPRMRELDAMLMDSVCESTDGCTVEPDGKCEHGHVSWLRYLGII